MRGFPPFALVAVWLGKTGHRAYILPALKPLPTLRLHQIFHHPPHHHRSLNLALPEDLFGPWLHVRRPACFPRKVTYPTPQMQNLGDSGDRHGTSSSEPDSRGKRKEAVVTTDFAGKSRFDILAATDKEGAVNMVTEPTGHASLPQTQKSWFEEVPFNFAAGGQVKSKGTKAKGPNGNKQKKVSTPSPSPSLAPKVVGSLSHVSGIAKASDPLNQHRTKVQRRLPSQVATSAGPMNATPLSVDRTTDFHPGMLISSRAPLDPNLKKPPDFRASLSVPLQLGKRKSGGTSCPSPRAVDQ